MIELVISGGQTGADQAGWRAAKAAGIQTGGWMPKGFLTLDGPRPEFAELYGAREHASSDWAPRTVANVMEADLTLWFGATESRGAKATYRAFRTKMEKGPDRFGIDRGRTGWVPSGSPVGAFHPERLIEFLDKCGVRILNVAGNRETNPPRIGAWVEMYLGVIFALMKEGA